MEREPRQVDEAGKLDPGRQRAGRRQASGSNENIGQVETVQLEYVRTQKFESLLTQLADIFNDESLSDTLKVLTLESSNENFRGPDVVTGGGDGGARLGREYH